MPAKPIPLAGAVLLLLAAAGPVAAQVNVHVERRRGGTVAVAVEAFVSAAPETVWETITDWDRLAQFLPSLESSRSERGPDGSFFVVQEGVATFLWYRFPIRVRFLVEEAPPRSLKFRSVEGNLLDMVGEYDVEPRGRRVLLGYRASFRPDFWLPAHIGPAVMEREYGRQFQALVAEIYRREARKELLQSRVPGAGF